MKNLEDLLTEHAEKFTDVYKTRNYDIFGFIKGNRNIDQPNLSKIVESIKKKLIPESSVIVGFDPSDPDGKFLKIIDGQHRYEACKKLDLPISFILMGDFDINLKEKSLEMVELLNTASKEWDITNFMNSKAVLGVKDYILYKDVYEEYKNCDPVGSGFEHEMMLHTLSIKQNKRTSYDDFKRGKLVFDENDQDFLKKIFDKLIKYSIKIDKIGRRYYLKAILEFLLKTDVDFKKVDTIILNDELKPTTSVKDAINQIISFYNYKTKKKGNQLDISEVGKGNFRIFQKYKIL